MSRNASDIIVLAPEGELRRRVLEVLPQAACYDSALEALADLAAARPRTFVASPAALGYRSEQILSAARSARPGAAIYLVCAPQEEAAARSVKEADDYFLCPYGLDELAGRVTEQARAAARPTVRAGDQAERPAHPGASRRAGIEASGPAAPDTSAGVLRAVQECLRAIAGAARHSAAEIAQAAVNAAAGLEGISAAAVLDAGRVSPAAASTEAADWAGAATALADASLPRDRWVALDERTRLYSSADPDAGGLALAVCARQTSLSEELLDGLTTVAQVALALIAAARDREAALKVLSTDAETGLATRRYFEHYLSALCRRAAQTRREVLLVLASPLPSPAEARASQRPSFARRSGLREGGSAAPCSAKPATQGEAESQSSTGYAKAGTGETAIARLELHPLAELLRASFPKSKLARVDETTLAAALALAPGGETSPDELVRRFCARVMESALPLPVALGAASFPWQAADAAALLAAAASRLAESRARGGQPVIS